MKHFNKTLHVACMNGSKVMNLIYHYNDR